jgi:hypothetical protein
MNQPVSAFPDMQEDIIDSPELENRADPVNEKHDRQVGGDEIVSQDDTRVQVIGHKSSFWVVIIHGSISMNKINNLYI